MRRLVLTAVAGAALAGGIAPTFAQSLPVTVHESTKGGVFVGVDVNGQPGAGASVVNGQACAGVGLQVPVCAPLPQIQRPGRQSLPVVVHHDDTRTVVGVGVVSVSIYSDGQICPGVSTQDWPCVGVQLG
jgi:hypothetical protein